MKSMFYAWWQSSALNYVASEHNYVDINKSNDNIIMLHVDIIYLACRGQKYATIGNRVIHAKIVFRNANIWSILTHFEKKYLFSKRFDLVPNLTHFLKVRNFSKCVITDQF